MRKCYLAASFFTAAMLGACAHAPSRDCRSFTPATLTIERAGDQWEIVDGRTPLFVFAREADARRALQVISYYRADQSCSVDAEHFRYLLVANAAPVGELADEDCLPFDPKVVEVSNVRGRWAVVYRTEIMFSFESQSDAERALSVIQQYGFTHTCFVGRPHPPFSYLRR